MKNKNNENNVTVTELVNGLIELQSKKGNREFAHSYALGTLQAILDWEIKGYSNGLQEAVNRAYDQVKNELDNLVIEPTVYERQVNKAKEALTTIGV